MISSHQLPLAARQAHPLGIAVALGAAAVAGTILVAQLIHARTVAGLLAALELIPGYRAPIVPPAATLTAVVALVAVMVAAYVLGLLVGIPLVALERRLERTNDIGMTVPDVLDALGHDLVVDRPQAEVPAGVRGETLAPIAVPLATTVAKAQLAAEPEPVRAPALVIGRAPVAAARAGTSCARHRVAASRERAAHRARYRYRTP